MLSGDSTPWFNMGFYSYQSVLCFLEIFSKFFFEISIPPPGSPVTPVTPETFAKWKAKKAKRKGKGEGKADGEGEDKRRDKGE